MERAELAGKLGVVQPKAGGHGPTVISEADPVRFMAALAGAVAGGGDVFLADPSWSENERAQITALVASGLAVPEPERGEDGWLMIATGGTGGRLKFARHDQRTIAAAVNGFQGHFGLGRINAVGLLPLHHVSGLMAWLRCALTGGEYRHLDWKGVEAGQRPRLPERPEGWVTSLVPTQLDRLLRSAAAVAWLRGFRLVFLGGAAASPGLLDRAAAAGLRLSPGYGMTETAAMVAALKPEEFLAGRRSSGTALPHTRITVDHGGVISIEGDSLFGGYFPEWRGVGGFVTSDLGRLDEHGHLHVLGRRDEVIITGGEKVNPFEVEAALRDTGEFPEVVVVGCPDPEWGQIVVAVHPAAVQPDLAKVKQLIGSQLPAWKRPRQYVPVPDWPTNAQGKVNRTEVMRRLGR